MLLDVKTLLAVLILGNCVIGLALLFAFAGRPCRGVIKWAVSLFIQGAGELLITLRGVIPDFLSIVFANVLLSTTYALTYAAINEFLEQRIRRYLYYGPILVTLAAFWLLLGNQPARFVASGLIFGAQQVIMVHLLVRARSLAGYRSRWIMLGAYVIGCMLFFGRALAAVISPDSFFSVFASNAAQSLSLMAAFAGIILSSFALLLMYRERLDSVNQRLAALDSLTEIYNRRAFMDLAHRELARGRRSAQPLSLILLDLDQFKQINDAHGHLTGDRVLVALVGRINECLRGQDILGRYGGEEFCVLLPDADEAGAFAVAERLRIVIAEKAFEDEDVSLRITISCGVATLPAGDECDLEAFLDRADKALYQAKKAGRNRVVNLPIVSSVQSAPSSPKK